MNIKSLIEYQNADLELYKLEREEQESKNIFDQLTKDARVAQGQTAELENTAAALLNEIETIKKQFELQEKKINEITQKGVDNLSKQEVDAYLALKDKLAQNLNILDRKLTKFAENVNVMLAQFNRSAKAYNTLLEKRNKSKQDYDAICAKVAPEKEKIEAQLKKLEKGVSADLLERYKKIRRDSIKPPFVVQLQNGNSCGGCHMQLSFAQVSKIKQEGMIACDNCHRIIYSD